MGIYSVTPTKINNNPINTTPRPNKPFITVHKAARFPGHWTYVYAPNREINSPNIIFNDLSIEFTSLIDVNKIYIDSSCY